MVAAAPFHAVDIIIVAAIIMLAAIVDNEWIFQSRIGSRPEIRKGRFDWLFLLFDRSNVVTCSVPRPDVSEQLSKTRYTLWTCDGSITKSSDSVKRGTKKQCRRVSVKSIVVNRLAMKCGRNVQSRRGFQRCEEKKGKSNSKRYAIALHSFAYQTVLSGRTPSNTQSNQANVR